MTETLFMDSSWDTDIFSNNTSQFVENAAAGHAKAIADVAGLSGSYQGGSGGSGGSGVPRYGDNNESFADYHSDWWGDEGPHIRAIQRLLQLNGELSRGSGSIDSIFGQHFIEILSIFT
ncbi:hypothetical protein HUG15_09880 [Salicibibacter cibarius]|uniref:Uncharacterized protein n=1 Tax=Salicibibacter cibarius TaxID=2743000 RepID=A0A7T6Z2X0_9BACI|nr:hypothetical protein [Salicibibacter cibarius]QQK75847.1 hypothetical protein HUG15_09880 [Salicibibacter cibarius]